jgi:hypothetical protein
MLAEPFGVRAMLSFAGAAECQPSDRTAPPPPPRSAHASYAVTCNLLGAPVAAATPREVSDVTGARAAGRSWSIAPSSHS